MLVSGLVNVPYLAPGISVQSLFDEHVSGLGNASGPVKTLKDLDQYVKVMSRKQDIFFWQHVLLCSLYKFFTSVK